MSKSDWKFFNCSEQHEINYVVSQYPKEYQSIIKAKIQEWCHKGYISNYTHDQLYSFIRLHLGIDRK